MNLPQGRSHDVLEIIVSAVPVAGNRFDNRIGSNSAQSISTLVGDIVLTGYPMQPIGDAATFFEASPLRALGGRRRRIGFRQVRESAVSPWSSPKSALCPVKIERPPGRKLFYRMEVDATMTLATRNLSEELLPSVKVRTVVEGFPGWAAEQVLKDVAPETTVTFGIAIPADRLRPDPYTVSVHAEPEGWASDDAGFPFTIVPRPNPNRFPVLMWGSVPHTTVPRLAELGFTAVFSTGVVPL